MAGDLDARRIPSDASRLATLRGELDLPFIGLLHPERCEEVDSSNSAQGYLTSRVAFPQRVAHALRDPFCVQVVLRAQNILRAVMDILVRDADAVEAHVPDPELLTALHDRCAEAAGERAFFNRNDKRTRLTVFRN